MPSPTSKRTKSSMNFAFLPKHRVRTFRPSKHPRYFYTAIPNDSFISEIPSPSTPPTSTTPKPSSLNYYISLTLQNSGSVARDHLASERTFLAYMRTSLALASAGVGMSVSVFFYPHVNCSIQSVRPCPIVHGGHNCRPSPFGT